MRPFVKFLLPVFLALSSALLQAQTPGVVVVGNARFTVVTPNLIRMEYAPDGKFVDLPSWFAVNRAARDNDAQITSQNGKVDIDTGVIHLTFQGDGKTAFSVDNLQAEIKKGTDKVTWKPGMPSTQNLGGTIRTVDGLWAPVSLGEGIISRDGWYLLDDSTSGPPQPDRRRRRRSSDAQICHGQLVFTLLALHGG
jgi:hypothetical protein